MVVQDHDDEDSDTTEMLSGMAIGDITVSAERVIVVRHALGWEAVTIAGGKKEDE
jgi:hypothetical protein